MWLVLKWYVYWSGLAAKRGSRLTNWLDIHCLRNINSRSWIGLSYGSLLCNSDISISRRRLELALWDSLSLMTLLGLWVLINNINGSASLLMMRANSWLIEIRNLSRLYGLLDDIWPESNVLLLNYFLCNILFFLESVQFLHLMRGLVFVELDRLWDLDLLLLALSDFLKHCFLFNRFGLWLIC